MAITKKLPSGDGRISVNGQYVPAKVHYYDIKEIVEVSEYEGPLDPLVGKLIIEGDRSFLSNLLLEMIGGACVLYLDDGRHVNFLLPKYGNDFSDRDNALKLTIELNGNIE